MSVCKQQQSELSLITRGRKCSSRNTASASNAAEVRHGDLFELYVPKVLGYVLTLGLCQYQDQWVLIEYEQNNALNLIRRSRAMDVGRRRRSTGGYTISVNAKTPASYKRTQTNVNK